MSEATRASLRNFIMERYDDLRSRLRFRLGSVELAEDALHDAFVRLERAEVAGEVRRPAAYVLRMASNLAANRRLRDQRLLSMEDVRAVLDIPDEGQNPAPALEAASEMARVKRALATLPERRRALLVGAWLDEVPVAELAVRHGIAVRTVQHEIQQALEQIRRKLASKREIHLRRVDHEMS